jgi:hypothetical protein
MRVRGLTDHALTVWRLNRVEIRAAVENRRSRAIPERFGFHQEGTLREAERMGDRYLDCVVLRDRRHPCSERGGAADIDPPLVWSNVGCADRWPQSAPFCTRITDSGH